MNLADLSALPMFSPNILLQNQNKYTNNELHRRSQMADCRDEGYICILLNFHGFTFCNGSEAANMSALKKKNYQTLISTEIFFLSTIFVEV